MIGKILLTMATRLVTEKFLTAFLIHIAEHLAKKTSNELDDKIISDIKSALGDQNG